MGQRSLQKQAPRPLTSQRDMKNTNAEATTQGPVYVGIDVAKDHLDVDLGGKVRQFDNTKQGVRKLLRELPPNAQLVVEATGHYHLRLLHAAHEAGVAISVVNPAWVRFFAKSSGKIAKTDAIDALMITAYAQTHRPKPSSASSANVMKLRQLQGLRDTFISQRVECQNHLEGLQDPALRRMLQTKIRALKATCARLEQAMEELVEADEDLKGKSRVMQANSGVGPQCAHTLLSQMPELGLMNSKDVAALAGLAPYNNDSGKFRGKRRVRGGRKKVRRALYMSALSASRYNPKFVKLKAKMKSDGKSGKVILIAIARRLLVILNAQIRDHLTQQAQAA